MAKKGRVFSGIRPTGRSHLGNYLGAIHHRPARLGRKNRRPMRPEKPSRPSSPRSRRATTACPSPPGRTTTWARGSRPSSDLMRVLLRPIKERGLFFVDSRTTAKTVALEEARKMGVPAAERNVFLDADEDRGRIRGRLIELFQKARKKGRAIGICHPFPETLAVLQSTFQLADVYNLEVVPVSRLVR